MTKAKFSKKTSKSKSDWLQQGTVTLAAMLGLSLVFVRCAPSEKGQNEAGTSSQNGDSRFEVEILRGDVSEPEFTGMTGFESLLEAMDSALEGAAAETIHFPEPKQSELDTEFCSGLSYGECLTLIVQVPASHLQISTGLSALNLAQNAPTYSGFLDKACHEGLLVGVPNIARQSMGRHRVLGAVKRTRCVFQTLSDETTPLPVLADNEMGFKVRLVEFDLSSKRTRTAPAFGSVAFERNRIDVRFHDAQVFGKGQWQPVRGAMNLWNIWNYSGIFGTAHAGIRFNESLGFRFNAAGTAAYLETVLTPILNAARRGEGLGEFAGDILVIRQAVAALAAGSNPVVPTLILIGVAVDAIRDLCEAEQSDCRIRGENSSLSEIYVSALGESSVVPSATRATLMDGLKHLPYALMKGVMAHAHFNELEKSLDLPTKPFWVGQ